MVIFWHLGKHTYPTYLPGFEKKKDPMRSSLLYNCDFGRLTFGNYSYNTDETVNGVGRPFPSPYNPVGPCITGVIDNREGHANPLDGYVIEEGTIPSALAPFFQTMLDIMPGSISSEETLIQRTQARLARWGSRLLGPYFKSGAVEKTQVYLIMSHDSKSTFFFKSRQCLISPPN